METKSPVPELTKQLQKQHISHCIMLLVGVYNFHQKLLEAKKSKDVKREVDLQSTRNIFLYVLRGFDIEVCALSVKLLPSPRAI